MKTLLVIDMQNDFINGALGTKEAEAIVPFVKDKIKEYREAGNPVFFTRDTHGEDYLDTQEGKNLPVKHCIEGTFGWQISDEIGFSEDDMVFDKNTFGYDWSQAVLAQPELFFGDEIELIGLCTDICVISNAMGLKTVISGNCYFRGRSVLRGSDKRVPRKRAGVHENVSDSDKKFTLSDYERICFKSSSGVDTLEM